LRAGDVVATPEGLTVFKGGSSFPYKTADFTPIDSYARVNSDLRKRLSTIKVDPTATPSTPVQTLAATTGEDAKPAAKPRRKRPVQAAQQAEREPRSPFGWFNR
jgi:hypothetical protein